ncbi:hypothetical protein BLOT_002735 [Blomia tropicalis]|nr:hypothetical protein BLOT_002735 [Blomia tropicalis]
MTLSTLVTSFEQDYDQQEWENQHYNRYSNLARSLNETSMLSPSPSPSSKQESTLTIEQTSSHNETRNRQNNNEHQMLNNRHRNVSRRNQSNRRHNRHRYESKRRKRKPIIKKKNSYMELAPSYFYDQMVDYEPYGHHSQIHPLYTPIHEPLMETGSSDWRILNDIRNNIMREYHMKPYNVDSMMMSPHFTMMMKRHPSHRQPFFPNPPIPYHLMAQPLALTYSPVPLMVGRQYMNSNPMPASLPLTFPTTARIRPMNEMQYSASNNNVSVTVMDGSHRLSRSLDQVLVCKKCAKTMGTNDDLYLDLRVNQHLTEEDRKVFAHNFGFIPISEAVQNEKAKVKANFHFKPIKVDTISDQSNIIYGKSIWRKQLGNNKTSQKKGTNSTIGKVHIFPAARPHYLITNDEKNKFIQQRNSQNNNNSQNSIIRNLLFAPKIINLSNKEKKSSYVVENIFENPFPPPRAINSTSGLIERNITEFSVSEQQNKPTIELATNLTFTNQKKPSKFDFDSKSDGGSRSKSRSSYHLNGKPLALFTLKKMENRRSSKLSDLSTNSSNDQQKKNELLDSIARFVANQRISSNNINNNNNETKNMGTQPTFGDGTKIDNVLNNHYQEDWSYKHKGNVQLIEMNRFDDEMV